MFQVIYNYKICTVGLLVQHDIRSLVVLGQLSLQKRKQGKKLFEIRKRDAKTRNSSKTTLSGSHRSNHLCNFKLHLENISLKESQGKAPFSFLDFRPQ